MLIHVWIHMDALEKTPNTAVLYICQTCRWHWTAATQIHQREKRRSGKLLSVRQLNRKMDPDTVSLLLLLLCLAAWLSEVKWAWCLEIKFHSCPLTTAIPFWSSHSVLSQFQEQREVLFTSPQIRVWWKMVTVSSVFYICSSLVHQTKKDH